MFCRTPTTNEVYKLVLPYSIAEIICRTQIYYVNYIKIITLLGSAEKLSLKSKYQTAFKVLNRLATADLILKYPILDFKVKKKQERKSSIY
jgi:hypothetical protein